MNLEFTATNEQIEHGGRLLVRYCSKCHWGGSGGAIPGLIYSKPETFEIFNQIVGEGAFLVKGMPKFNDRLSEQDIQDIKFYLLSSAQLERNKK